MSDPDLVDRVHDADIVGVTNGEQRLMGRGGLVAPRCRHVVDCIRLDVRDAVLLLHHPHSRARYPRSSATDLDHHPGRRGCHVGGRWRHGVEFRLWAFSKPSRAHHHHIILRRRCRPHPGPDTIYISLSPAPGTRLAGTSTNTHHFHPRRSYGPDRRSIATPRRRRKHRGEVRRVQPRHILDS